MRIGGKEFDTNRTYQVGVLNYNSILFSDGGVTGR